MASSEDGCPGCGPSERRPTVDDGATDEGRRALLLGGSAFAIALGVPGVSPASAAADKPDRQPLQAGDRLQVVTAGPLEGQQLKPEMLTDGERPVEAFPYDPAAAILKDGNRLNRVLALRLPRGEMDPATRERSADGVLVYSAICTHKNCTVESWMPDERHLRCPCHLSEFAALAEGNVKGGPARLPLPMVPLDVDEEGFVIATDTFNRKPGSSS